MAVSRYRRNAAGWIGAATTLLLAMITLAGCESDPCGSEGLAKVMAEKFVKRELRDPGSAKFENTSAKRSADDACVYVVQGMFSAKNGFGGTNRGVFITEMRKRRGENSWSAHDMIIQ